MASFTVETLGLNVWANPAMWNDARFWGGNTTEFTIQNQLNTATTFTVEANVATNFTVVTNI